MLWPGLSTESRLGAETKQIGHGWPPLLVAEVLIAVRVDPYYVIFVWLQPYRCDESSAIILEAHLAGDLGKANFILHYQRPPINLHWLGKGNPDFWQIRVHHGIAGRGHGGDHHRRLAI